MCYPLFFAPVNSRSTAAISSWKAVRNRSTRIRDCGFFNSLQCLVEISVKFFLKPKIAQEHADVSHGPNVMGQNLGNGVHCEEECVVVNWDQSSTRSKAG